MALISKTAGLCISTTLFNCHTISASFAGRIEPGAAVLALALYFWQLPHFLSLAWLCKEDYIRGGYAMLPRYDPLGRRTAACALRNSLYMLPLGFLAVWVCAVPTRFFHLCSKAPPDAASQHSQDHVLHLLKHCRHICA